MANEDKENTNKKYPVYRLRIKRFYPNAQVVLNEKEKGIEALKDIHSDAITACKISDEEDERMPAMASILPWFLLHLSFSILQRNFNKFL